MQKSKSFKLIKLIRVLEMGVGSVLHSTSKYYERTEQKWGIIMCPWGCVNCKKNVIYKWRVGNYCIIYFEEKQDMKLFEIKGIVSLKIDMQSNYYLICSQLNNLSCWESAKLRYKPHSHCWCLQLAKQCRTFHCFWKKCQSLQGAFKTTLT